MNRVQLVRMANQIGAFFAAMPDRKQAAQDVASHIQRNWEPRMIDALQRCAAAGEDGDMSAIVGEALSLLPPATG